MYKVKDFLDQIPFTGLNLPNPEMNLSFEVWSEDDITNWHFARTYPLSQAKYNADGTITLQSLKAGPNNHMPNREDHDTEMILTPCYTDRLLKDGRGAQQDSEELRRMTREDDPNAKKFTYVFAYKAMIRILSSGGVDRAIIAMRDYNGAVPIKQAIPSAFAQDLLHHDDRYLWGVRHNRVSLTHKPSYGGWCWGVQSSSRGS